MAILRRCEHSARWMNTTRPTMIIIVL